MTQTNKQQNNKQSDPWSSAANGSASSAIERATDWVVGAHSPKGLMWIGWINLVTSQVLNLGFWMSVVAGVGAIEGLSQTLQGDLKYLAGLVIGAIISMGSSFFQGYPIVQSRAASNIFSDILAGAFRPNVSSLPKGVDRDRATQYQEVSSSFNRTMKKLGTMATGLEVMAGIVFMGSIFGGGWAAITALMMFVYSIVGTQLGLMMVIQAHNVHLPAAGRDALRKLQGKAKAEVFQALK